MRHIALAIWGLVALAFLAGLAGLFVYVDARLGEAGSLLLLGMFLGLPFLLVVAAVLGLYFVLLVRGLSHLQHTDDAGEIGRMRAVLEGLRLFRVQAQTDLEQTRLERQQVRALGRAPWASDPWSVRPALPGPGEAVDPWFGLSAPLSAGFADDRAGEDVAMDPDDFDVL